MNLDWAAIWLVSLLTCSFLVKFSGIPSIALIWSGLTSMPRCDTRKPRNFLEVMPNAYFSGFRFMLYHLSISKASLRKPICKCCKLPVSSRLAGSDKPTKRVVRFRQEIKVGDMRNHSVVVGLSDGNKCFSDYCTVVRYSDGNCTFSVVLMWSRSKYG